MVDLIQSARTYLTHVDAWLSFVLTLKLTGPASRTVLLIRGHGATVLLALASKSALTRLSSETACCERQMSWHKSVALGSFSSLPRAAQDLDPVPLALLPPSVLSSQGHCVIC